MIRLDRTRHRAALGLYRAADMRFPLIGAVVLDHQNGAVYVDDEATPTTAYVEHAFGFAQVLGRATPSFESALAHYMLVDKSRSGAKIRLYGARTPAFLAEQRYAGMRSWRQRFVISPGAVPSAPGPPARAEIELLDVDLTNIAIVEDAFGVVRRFWRSESDFIKKANPVVVARAGAPAAICYAAAEADGEVEIDVMTQPEEQRRGLGKIATTTFVRRCFERSLTPLWDCFANNTASMELCRSIGFTPSAPPYDFYTISK